MPSRRGLVVRRRVPLAPFCSFGTGGPSDYLAKVRSTEDVRAAVEFAGRHTAGRIAVLGGGSNVVVSDDGFPGLTIVLEPGSARFQPDGTVTCQGGVSWDALVAGATARHLYGLECLSGIPGTVGAAPVQNIAAYGQQLSDTFVSLKAVPADGAEITMGKQACDFSYRHSQFRAVDRPPIITEVTLRLGRAAAPYDLYRDLAMQLGQPSSEGLSAPAIRSAVLDVRRRKSLTWVGVAEEQRAKNAGSFFVSPFVAHDVALAVTGAVVGEQRAAEFLSWYSADPDHRRDKVKVSAAHVLLACGFNNGDRWGPVALARSHVLAVTNLGGATSADVLGVARIIGDRARAEFGIDLTIEPRLVGEVTVTDGAVRRLEQAYAPAGRGRPEWVHTH